MRQYLDLLSHVMDTGADRTGTGTRLVFGYRMPFDLAEGFPVTTTKKTVEPGGMLPAPSRLADRGLA